VLARLPGPLALVLSLFPLSSRCAPPIAGSQPEWVSHRAGSALGRLPACCGGPIASRRREPALRRRRCDDRNPSGQRHRHSGNAWTRMFGIGRDPAGRRRPRVVATRRGSRIPKVERHLVTSTPARRSGLRRQSEASVTTPRRARAASWSSIERIARLVHGQERGAASQRKYPRKHGAGATSTVHEGRRDGRERCRSGVHTSACSSLYFSVATGSARLDTGHDAQPNVGLQKTPTPDHSGKLTDAALRVLSKPERHAPFFAWIHYLTRTRLPSSSRCPRLGTVSGTLHGEVCTPISRSGGSGFRRAAAVGKSTRCVHQRHGEAFGEHHFIDMVELWEELVRVPLIVYVPAPSASRDVRRSASICATLLDLFGVKGPESAVAIFFRVSLAAICSGVRRGAGRARCPIDMLPVEQRRTASVPPPRSEALRVERCALPALRSRIDPAESKDDSPTRTGSQVCLATSMEGAAARGYVSRSRKMPTKGTISSGSSGSGANRGVRQRRRRRQLREDSISTSDAIRQAFARTKPLRLPPFGAARLPDSTSCGRPHTRAGWAKLSCSAPSTGLAPVFDRPVRGMTTAKSVLTPALRARSRRPARLVRADGERAIAQLLERLRRGASTGCDEG